jgi:hypothetical protein
MKTIATNALIVLFILFNHTLSAQDTGADNTALMTKLASIAASFKDKSLASANNTQQKLEIIDEKTVTGKEFKRLNKFGDPMRWYVVGASRLYKNKSNCFIFKKWSEEYSYERAPAETKQNYRGKTKKGMVYISFTPDGNIPFIFTIATNNPAASLTREKNLFGVSKVIKHISSTIFPDKVYTNDDNTKFLYQIVTDDSEFPYLNTFIDVAEYRKIYECLSAEEKGNYINPDTLIKELAKIK